MEGKNAAFAIAALALFLFAGCAQNAAGQADSNKTESGYVKTDNISAGPLAAAKGDTVQVDYVGKLQDGTVFDTSMASVAKEAGLPLRDSYDFLEFKVGAGEMISGFDSAVLGMKEGDEKTVTLAPEQAYGGWSPDRVFSIPVERIGNASDIKVGSVLYAQNGATGHVTEITNGTAKVDFNHELAGKTLVFTIKMVKIRKK